MKVGILEGSTNVVLNLLGLVNPIRALLVLEVLSLFLLWQGWPSVLSLLAVTILIMGIQTVASQITGFGTLAELGEFLIGSSFGSYKAIELEEYLTSLGGDYQKETPPKTNSSPAGLSDRFLWYLHRNGQYEIRTFVFRPSVEKSLEPSEIPSFPTVVGTWMFLPFAPKEMQNIDKFKFLHEVGHASTSSISRNETAATVLAAALICLAYLALRLEWTPLSTLLFLAVTAMSACYLYLNRDNEKIREVDDEIRADYFALSRSDPKWFRSFPAERLSELLCHMPSIEPTILRYRKEAFAQTLESIRENRTPPPIEKFLVPTRHRLKLRALSSLMGAIFLFLFFWFEAASWVSVIQYSVGIALVALVLLITASSLHHFSELILLKTSGSDVSEGTVDFLRSVSRDLDRVNRSFPKLGERLAKIQDAYEVFARIYERSQVSKIEESHYGLSVGSLPPLFDIEEVDIRVDEENSVAYLYFSKELPGVIDKVLFHPEIAAITFLCGGNSAFRLGLRIPQESVSTFTGIVEIVLVRTRSSEGEVSEIDEQHIVLAVGRESDEYLYLTSRERVGALRLKIDNHSRSSPKAIAEAQTIVDGYRLKDIYGLLRNTDDATFLSRPAFTRALISRFDC